MHVLSTLLLQVVADNDFARITYTEAVAIVQKVPGPKPGVPWEFPPEWGEELQTEHEKCVSPRPGPDPRLRP